MPSVFTLDAPCPWTLAVGDPRKKRLFHGCFQTKGEAEAFADKLNSGGYRRVGRWRPVFNRPPGVPMNGASLGGYSGYHLERAKRFIKEADFHILKAKHASIDFDCKTGLREARRAVKAAAKATVNAHDSKDWRTISRTQKLETQTNRLVDMVGKRCFAVYGKLPMKLRPRRR